jgi:hypothetical protein
MNIDTLMPLFSHYAILFSQILAIFAIIFDADFLRFRLSLPFSAFDAAFLPIIIIIHHHQCHHQCSLSCAVALPPRRAAAMPIAC